ncbi:hypothetical protein [Nonlabens ulvanivorans]|uniref:hypothetical protein n=1 Tax=Nonlabens ulvanivorans TaxID=906888 RepID=UPI0037C53E4D
MSFRYFYMMRILSILFVLILGISCTEKVEESKPLIEIYELNKWVESYESVPLDSSMIAKFIESKVDTTRVRYSKEFGTIINGGFAAMADDLKIQPLISNSKIKGFDFNHDIIVIDSSAIDSLYSEIPFQKARQLALTIDKEVILSFYERSHLSSYRIGNAMFFNGYNDLLLEEQIPKYPFYLKLCKGPMEKVFTVKPNLKKDTAFYNAFKRAGKIIAE